MNILRNLRSFIFVPLAFTVLAFSAFANSSAMPDSIDVAKRCMIEAITKVDAVQSQIEFQDNLVVSLLSTESETQNQWGNLLNAEAGPHTNPVGYGNAMILESDKLSTDANVLSQYIARNA